MLFEIFFGIILLIVYFFVGFVFLMSGYMCSVPKEPSLKEKIIFFPIYFFFCGFKFK